MARDIKHLAKDLEFLIEDAVGASASKVHFSLQYVSPWWTGSFNQAWEISDTPISPELKRTLGTGQTLAMRPGTYNTLGQEDWPDRTLRKAPSFISHPAKLGRSLYVGNMMEYAGFVVNKSGATASDSSGNPIEYWEHAENVGGNITPRPRVADWFWIYLQHGRAKFLLKDMDSGFSKAGFKPLGIKYKPTAM